MPEAPLLAIVNGSVLLDRRLVDDAVVIIRGGRIAAAGPARATPVPRGARRLDARGLVVSPGFLDIHIHGSGGCRAEDDAPGMARHIIRNGTTWFLPTLMSDQVDRMLAAIDRVRAALGPQAGGATIGGIHLEGPYLNPKYGAQRSSSNVAPDPHTVRRLITRCRGALRLVTIAPERPGALAAIRAFRRAGATVAIGHSDATEPQYLAARRAGITHATHLFNAMARQTWPAPDNYRGVKTVGIEELILADAGMTADIMADATAAHVHPTMLRVACKCLDGGRLSLITDAMSAAGLPFGEYRLADGQSVFTTRGEDVARLANGGLCGSALSLCGALRNWMKHTGASLESALTMVTEAPARAVGVFARRGSLTPGKVADLTLLDRRLRVRRVFVAGREEFNLAAPSHE
ncbi:MAG: N-acetylglucosamine-6-phosphate deacetylase [Opitutaceae bacterium]|nr:N-acetylglucosamine-6-phosphate deacetylase [Opitutaceae bacterium]